MSEPQLASLTSIKTRAGQAFLDWWRGREYVTVMLDWATIEVAAIEREAGQQAERWERERIRALLKGPISAAIDADTTSKRWRDGADWAVTRVLSILMETQ